MTPGAKCRWFCWHVLRYVARHKVLAALNVASVALGVTVFLAIQITNQSASKTFRSGVDLVAGKADLEVRGRIPDGIFPQIASIPGVAAATPVVEGVAALADGSGEYLQILGTDPFTDAPFRTFQLDTDGTFDVEPWLAKPGLVALTPEWMEATRSAVGDPMEVISSGRVHTLTAHAVIELDGGTAGQSRMAVMDIGWAQELLGNAGYLTGILMLLETDADRDAVLGKVRDALPADVRAGSPKSRSQQVERMLSAFQLNLTALSSVSLLVGMFLIHNTISASVVRRHEEIGTLRAMGVTRREIRALFLGEAALYGMAGAVLGIVAGGILSGGLLGAVSQTISSLYILTNIETPQVDAARIALCMILGTGSAVLAAWQPSSAATRVDPVEALEMRAADQSFPRPRPALMFAGFGTLLGAAAFSWLALESGWAWLGFAAAFCVLAGFACWAPWMVAGAGTAAAMATARSGWVELRLAASNFRRALFRNGINVAALMAAIAMMIGVGTMIHSFRTSVNTWVSQTMTADFFASPASNSVAGVRDVLSEEVLGFLQTHVAVAELDTYLQMEITFRGEAATLATVLAPPGKPFRFVGGDAGRKLREFRRPGNVIVTESFAGRFGLRDGDSIHLQTPQGGRKFRIAGIYRDYTSDLGVVLLHRSQFDPLWNDPRVNSAAVTLGNGWSTEEFERVFLSEFPGGEVLLFTNAGLRERVMEIFDQTFAVTHVLRSISIAVAVAGIFLTLTTLVAERRRELGILKSMGASRRQIGGMVLVEAGLSGACASVLGIAAGTVLSVVLTHVINKAFFGWTIELAIPWAWVWATPLWIVPVSVAAAWPPARAAARVNVAVAVRNE